MKEIKIQVPDGKRAEWKNGVLTLVDEPQVDNRPVTERIKTFEDACNALGQKHPFVRTYSSVSLSADTSANGDLIAYLKLRIIVAALNEGWEPQFVKGEYRYYPWFWLYPQEEYDEMDEDKKRRCVLRSGYSTDAYCGFVHVNAYSDASGSSSGSGSRLAFRTSALAKYAGEQFTEEWADFLFKPRTGEGLNGKSEADNSETIDFSDNDDE